MRRKKKKRNRAIKEAAEEAGYVCPTCGERIVIPIDPTQGSEQQYGEDCPVCCNPNVIHVEFEADWDAPRVWAEAE